MREAWDKKMPEKIGICARAEDKVAYLYNEATPSEARDFENHMQRCASCSAEVAEFGDVREAIGEWRWQALGSLSSTAVEVNTSTALTSARETSVQRRSALTALREFFTLSPMWMRAATAVVALVFCTLAIIAVAHFAEQPKVVVVERPSKTERAPETNTTQVANTDRKPGEVKVEVKDQSETPRTVVVGLENKMQTQRPIKRGATNSPQLASKRKQILPRNINKPSEELASANDYLPFTATSREDKLPSLVDLVDDPN
jgi:anti-sigma factor RsiW